MKNARFSTNISLYLGNDAIYRAALPWVWGFPWVWVWDGYGDYDESPWVCGDSMGIFEWIPNYVETS